MNTTQSMHVVVSLLLTVVASADAQQTDQQTSTPTLTAVRLVRGAPEIDGQLDESVWADAQVATGFTQLEPHPGNPATQRSEARVLYDEDAIYIGMWFHDTNPDSIVAQLARRDDHVYSDWAYVALDSYFDHRTAFGFGLNPRGVKIDLLLHDDTKQEPSWDAVWDGSASIVDDGWIAEFRIPLSQLRFTLADGQEMRWGVNFGRFIARRNEEVVWAPIPADRSRWVSAFGTLRGLQHVKTPGGFEVMPYVAASVNQVSGQERDPLHQPLDPSAAAGADLKVGVTPDLTLTAAFNPDFGQVEADPSVVNLTAFETFFPEKRPFFMEGVEIFRFGSGPGHGPLSDETLFYSRRVGRVPQGVAEGDYVEAPDVTTILGAGKLSGKMSDGWSMGVLDAVTAREEARLFDEASGTRARQIVEPLTNYGVARVIKDFRDGQSAIGAVFTTTNRALPHDGSLGFLRSAAYAGGFDGRHRFAGGTYEVMGSLVGSYIRGAAEAIDEVQTSAVHYYQRPDADHLDYDSARTSLSGMAATAKFMKITGNWRFGASILTWSPGFEVNDLGFQRRSDLAIGGFWGSYTQYDANNLFRRSNVEVSVLDASTYGREQLGFDKTLSGSFEFMNLSGGHFGLNFETGALSPWLLRGGPAFLVPGSFNWWAGLHTDRGKAVAFNVQLNGSIQEETDGRRISLNPGIHVRPSSNVDLRVAPDITWNTNALQYVGKWDEGGRSYFLLGTVDQTTFSLTGRLDWTFSPTLSVQFYAQPFISAGKYGNYRYLTNPRAAAYTDRVHILTGSEIRAATDADGEVSYFVDIDHDGVDDFDFGDPSFNFKQLRSNLVLRWEYLPGSTIFLVWSQGRTHYTTDGRFRFRDNINTLFRTAGTNVLLLKISYWLGL